MLGHWQAGRILWERLAFGHRRKGESSILEPGMPIPSRAPRVLPLLKLFKGWKSQKRAAELAGSLREKANHVLRKKGIHGRLYGSNSILFIYVGPIEMEPSDATLPPSRDVSKIVGMLPVKVRLSHQPSSAWGFHPVGEDIDPFLCAQ